MDKFYMCYVNGTPCTSHKHETEGEASKEAERLALLNIGKKVYVLSVVSCCQAEKPVVKWVNGSKYSDGWQ
jgi:hypothetical protein